MNLLIVKPTALGDVAQALRVVPLLKHSGKVQKLSWIVDEDYRALLELYPEIDEIISYPRRRWRKQFNLQEVWSWGKALEGRFDTVLDLQGLARSGWMSWMTGAPRRIGLETAREGSRLAYTELVQDRCRHAVDRYRLACEQVFGEKLGEYPSENLKRAGNLPPGLEEGKFIVLHPYSLWETKLWPWNNFNDLAGAHPGETFVMIGQGELFPVTAPNVVDFRNATPKLDQLLGILAGARALISTDSGPAHVAAAVGCPVICLFGATDPGKTSPRGDRVEILYRELPCRPCLRRRCKISEKMACLRGLSVEQVSETLEKLVKKNQL